MLTAPATGTSPGLVTLTVDALLDDPDTPSDDLPLELLSTRLVTFPGAVTGIDTDDLVDDPAYTGAPSVTPSVWARPAPRRWLRWRSTKRKRAPRRWLPANSS